MNFEDFIKKNLVRKAHPDIFKTQAILSSTEEDMKTFSKLNLNDFPKRRLFVSYYDMLRSLLEAIALKQGYKIYSHTAFTYFLKKINEDVLSIKFDRLRQIRNGINYYGKDLSKDEAEELIKEIISMIKILKGKYLKN